MPKLTIHRQSEWMNRFRVVKIYMNDELLGVVPNNTKREFVVKPGSYTFTARIDWYGSKSIPMSFTNSSHIEVNMKGPKLEKTMMIVSTLIGLTLAYLMIIGLANKVMFISGLLLVVGYRIYYFTLGRNAFIQTDVINNHGSSSKV